MSEEIENSVREVFHRHRQKLTYHLAAPRREELLSSVHKKSAPTLVIPIAACLLLSVGFLLGRTFSSPAENPLSREIASAHVRSLMVNHLTDVASSDRHTVKPWFEGKLDFAPFVPDLASHGYPLTGGRLDYIAARPVAALAYMRRKHAINLFQWPVSTANEKPRLSVERGYNIYSWVGAGWQFWLASDLNAAELQSFTELIMETITAK